MTADTKTIEQRRDEFITYNMAHLIVDCITMSPPLDALAREHLNKAPAYGVTESAVLTAAGQLCPTTRAADLRRFQRGR